MWALSSRVPCSCRSLKMQGKPFEIIWVPRKFLWALLETSIASNNLPMAIPHCFPVILSSGLFWVVYLPNIVSTLIKAPGSPSMLFESLLLLQAPPWSRWAFFPALLAWCPPHSHFHSSWLSIGVEATRLLVIGTGRMAPSTIIGFKALWQVSLSVSTLRIMRWSCSNLPSRGLDEVMESITNIVVFQNDVPYMTWSSSRVGTVIKVLCLDAVQTGWRWWWRVTTTNKLGYLPRFNWSNTSWVAKVTKVKNDRTVPQGQWSPRTCHLSS